MIMPDFKQPRSFSLNDPSLIDLELESYYFTRSTYFSQNSLNKYTINSRLPFCMIYLATRHNHTHILTKLLATRHNLTHILTKLLQVSEYKMPRFTDAE